MRDVERGAGPLLPRAQEDRQRRRIIILGTILVGQARGGAADGIADHRQHQPFGLVDEMVELRKAGPLGRVQPDLDHAGILGRDQFGVEAQEQPACGPEQQADRDDDRRGPGQRAEQATPIGGFDPREGAIDPAGEPAGLLMAQQLRAQHRRQAERQHAGDRDRGDHRHRQLAEQCAGLPGDEHHRHEHRAHHRRGRDDREADLAGAAIGGDQRRLARFDPVMDVLEHDDRVVDHQPDRQHHGEQGQQVERIAQHPEDGEAGQQADRHGERGDEGRAPAAQEQEDHQHHQDCGLGQRVPDPFDRTFDKDRDVGGRLDRHAGGKLRLDLRRQPLGGLRDGERIGAGLADDAHAHADLAVEAEGRVGIFRPLLDARDIAQPHQIAVAATPHYQGAEVGRGGETAIDPQRQVLLGGFDPPGGQFHILRAQRRLDIARGQPIGGQPIGIEPDPHRRARLAAEIDLRDAVDRREAIDQEAFDIISQPCPAPARHLHAQEDDRLRIGIDLAHLGRQRVLGQIVDRPRDAIAHVVGRRVHVPAGPELDRDIRSPIGRARDDRIDALDPRQPFLERLGDPAFDDRRRGAGIDRSDRYDRRIGFGIFANGQLQEGHDPDHRQQDRADRRDHRPADREIGQHHEGAPLPSSGSPCTRMAEPSAILTTPSPITRAPAGSPLTSTIPLSRSPVAIRVRTALWSGPTMKT